MEEQLTLPLADQSVLDDMCLRVEVLVGGALFRLASMRMWNMHFDLMAAVVA